jgi:hypothetical protein
VSFRIEAEAILEAIKTHLAPKVNKHYERAIFNMAKQDVDASYEGYFDKLREFISSCQYGKMKDELLLDKIIYSIKDENLREDREITLTQAINKC